MTAEKINAAAWAAALRTERAVEEVPDGWYTVHQLSQQLGKATSTVGALVAKATLNGKCERRTFCIVTGSVTRPVPHYKLQ